MCYLPKIALVFRKLEVFTKEFQLGKPSKGFIRNIEVLKTVSNIIMLSSIDSMTIANRIKISSVDHIYHATRIMLSSVDSIGLSCKHSNVILQGIMQTE